jgi:hypothetical protein
MASIKVNPRELVFLPRNIDRSKYKSCPAGIAECTTPRGQIAVTGQGPIPFAEPVTFVIGKGSDNFCPSLHVGPDPA